MLHSLHNVKLKTSLSKATIYRLISEGKFPKPVKISTRRVGWRESDLDRFIASCAEK